MADVPCPFCGTILEPGHVSIASFGGLGSFPKAVFTPAGRGGSTKLFGGWTERAAGLCPECETVVLAPSGKRDNRTPQV